MRSPNQGPRTAARLASWPPPLARYRTGDGLLAAVGRASVRSRPRPRVVVISTGSELREPGTTLGHDSIYDGNSFLLAAAARQAGAIAYRVGIVSDQPRVFMDALSDQLVRADLVVTSGGVSMGDYDVVKEALSPLGTVWFGRASCRERV